MDRGLRDYLDRQDGIVTRAQVIASGRSDDWLAHQVRAARWQSVDRGVYSATTGPLTRAQRHWAAVLRCGDGAALAGQTAIGLWIPNRPEPRRCTVAVDERRRVEGTTLDVVLVEDLDNLVHPVREPRRLRLEEAVLMSASRAPTVDDAVGLVADACGSLCTSPARLRDTIHRLPSNLRFRRPLRELLDDVASGAYSYLEVHYLKDVERPHGLPTGDRQRRVTSRPGRCYRDVEYVGFDVVAELDGRLGHELYSDRGDDMDRDNIAVTGGSVSVRFGYRHVLRRTCETAAVVGDLLRPRGWRGDLSRCGPRCRLG